MANDKKSEGGKAPAKVETVNLKVLIHCEGCKKKVKKILNNVEGVHTVDVDGSLGKVTVTGTVDSKMLIKKLEKAGKVAEVLASGGGSGKGKEQQKDQQKGENKEAKEEKSGGGEGDKKGKGGGGGGGEGDKKGQGNNNGGGDSNNNKGNNSGGGSANNGESGKKKKGGGGDGGGGGGDGDGGLDEAGPNKNTANKNIAPIMVETGYSSMESAEYATHIFSDENANNCHIM